MQLTTSAQTLVNRYSFSDIDNGSGNIGASVADSVGGASWDGTLPNGGDLADFPGQLLLSASSQQYVQLPAGILSNYTAVTIDCWATFGTLPANCFLYGFGDTDTNPASANFGAGENYIFCQPENGRIAITAVDPGWEGEQGCLGAGNLSGLTAHVTSVYNPVAGYIELYLNGVLVGVNNAVTVQMNQVSNQLNYIARSLFTADSYMDVELNEFRIWNGALNALQVAGCDVAGPDTVGGAANAGTVTGIQLSIPQYQLVQGTHEAGSVMAQATLLPYSIDITRLATLSSDNTNILTITNGVIYAVGQGSANVIASYSSLTSTQIITVIQPASALVHRYSFTTDTSDSVGGAGWAGTLMGSAYVSGGQLVLPNVTSAVALDYLQLPAGILTNANGIGTNFNDPAVTIETWATINPGQYTWANLFDFGAQDSSGNAEYDVHVCVHSGNNPGNNTVIAIADSDNSNAHNQGFYGGSGTSLDGQTNLEIAAVFNPPAGYLAIYTNGVLMGKNTAVTITMAGVWAVLNKVGADNWPDPGMQGSIDELRIYNGALTSQGVAISSAAGPNSIPAAVTNGPGALLSLSIQAPATLQCLQAGSVKLLANYDNLSNWDILGNSVFPPAGLTLSISDTNVLTYASGIITGVNPGTASIVTVYQGITNTASVTVVQAPPATLAHRYSFFNEPDGSLLATDLVAAANGTLQGSANITGGQLVIPNTAQTAPAPDYLLLPDGILTNAVNGVLATNGVGTIYNDPAVTVEAWATFAASQGYWAALFDFGYTDASGFGAYDIHVGQLGGSTTFGISDTDNANVFNQTGTAGSVRGTSNMHIVAVFNPPAGYLALYTNGVLASQLNGISIPMAGVWGTLNKVGADLWPDPGMQGSISEFRIYNGVMSPNDVLATQLLGPTQVLASTVSLSAAVSGGNVVLSWPAAGGSYSLQSTASLTSGAWTTISTPVAQVVGSQWQVTLPNTGGAKFFRLAR